MSRPTIASLEETIYNLNKQVQGYKTLIQESGEMFGDLVDSLWGSDRETLLEIAEHLGAHVETDREVNITVQISGTVKCRPDQDVSDFVLLAFGREVSCGDVTVQDFESDLSLEVTDSYFD